MQTKQNQHVTTQYGLGLTAAVLSPLLSGVATVLFAATTRYFPPLYAAAFSSFVGAILLAVFSPSIWKRAVLRSARENWKGICAVAFWRILIGSSIFAVGIHYTDAIKAVFFTKIEPYFVLAWGWVLYREKVSRNELLLLFIHIIGAFLVSTGGKIERFSTAQYGDALIVLSMCISGFSYFYARKLSSAMGARPAAVASEGLGGIFAFPVAYFLTTHALPASVSPEAWWYLFTNILLFNTLALPLWFFALQSVRGWMVSAVRAVGPLAGAPTAYFLLGDTMNEWQLLGGALVIVTSALIARAHWKSRVS